MGASDNVVRGGLTTKPVDVDDLLAVVDSEPLDDPVMPLATMYPLNGTSIRLLRLVGPQERRPRATSSSSRRTGGRGSWRPGISSSWSRTSWPTSPRRDRLRVPGHSLSDLDDPFGGVVGVVALGVEQRLRSLAASRSALAVSARAIAASMPCSLMNSAHSTSDVDHLVLWHDGDVAAAHEEVAALVAGGDAEVGLARLAGAVDDAAHHRHLQRELPLAEGLHRPLGDVDDVDLGPPARRAGDEVDVLALAQAERLEQLPAGPGLLDRVGGQRVADRVADALEQQRGDAGRGLDQPGRRRPGLGDAEVQRVVGDLRRAGGRPRPSAARSTP